MASGPPSLQGWAERSDLLRLGFLGAALFLGVGLPPDIFPCATLGLHSLKKGGSQMQAPHAALPFYTQILMTKKTVFICRWAPALHCLQGTPTATPFTAGLGWPPVDPLGRGVFSREQDPKGSWGGDFKEKRCWSKPCGERGRSPGGWQNKAPPNIKMWVILIPGGDITAGS